MGPPLVVALLWMLFGGTHVGLATGPVRARLVARLGELGFTLLFWLVAAASFALLVGYYAAHRLEGTPGLALGDLPVLRPLLLATIVTGIALASAALVSYPRSPMALFRDRVHPARGIERITRHPFFVGVALMAVAHTLLATRLVGTVFFACLVLLAVVGAWHQDKKLLVVRGWPYADYLATTSAVPFAAVVAGRQRLVYGELPLATLAAGLGLAFALRAIHAGIFAHGGAWVIAVVVGGAGILTLQSWRRARRLAARPARLQPPGCT